MRSTYWLLLALTLAMFAFINLWSMPIIRDAAGGLEPFDLRPLGYTTKEAREFLAALLEPGLEHYLGTQRRLDQVFPALLAVTLSWTCWRLYGAKYAIILSGLALLGGFFDYQENIAVLDLLKLGADRIDEEVVSIASLFTILKFPPTLIVVVAILGALAFRFWRWKRG